MADKWFCAKVILWVMILCPLSVCLRYLLGYDTWTKISCKRRISPSTHISRWKGIKIFNNDTNLSDFPGQFPKNLSCISWLSIGFKHYSLSWNILAFGFNNYRFSQDQIYVQSRIKGMSSSLFLYRSIIEKS